ncbi:zinc finger protein 337 [Drosophila obscura]|uniref:zinc finger protein 337 n=1 Tax=Drosophila obscura TaxID=7282 RepID=UPI001BB18011|nr:zinc finger protein 337 [Drosophila obscura]
MEAQPRIVYVCSLCLRQYDLMEDLRGHMVFYHGCQPVAGHKAAKTPTKTQSNAARSTLEQQTIDSQAEIAAPPPTDLQPMPFKDFRLVLRANMREPCSASKECLFKFEDARKMEVHRRCHKGGSFSCCECALELSNWRRCSAHLWKVHQIDVDLLRCPALECNYNAPVSALVWRHMRVHKKWRPRVLRSLAAVQRRRKLKEQSGEPASQPAAPPATPKKNKYYAEKTCEICNRRFVNGKTLSKHVKTVHNKIKPFICNVCGKKTARKASLIIHMRQHTGEKPLQCEQCKFSTRDPSVLHKHRQRHGSASKQRTLKCGHCDYGCIQANALKRHMRLNHADAYRDLCCDLCSYTSINAERLQAHKQDHRQGLITNCEDSMDAARAVGFKYPRKLSDKNNEISADCFMPLESVDSLPHEPAVDTGGVTIPAPTSDDTQFPTYLKD